MVRNYQADQVRRTQRAAAEHSSMIRRYFQAAPAQAASAAASVNDVVADAQEEVVEPVTDGHQNDINDGDSIGVDSAHSDSVHGGEIGAADNENVDGGNDNVSAYL